MAAGYLADGTTVYGLVRSAAGARRLEEQGIRAVVADLDAPMELNALPLSGATAFYFAPPPGSGTADPRMERFLDALTPDRLPERMLYISTTGVYGDCGGAWITEEQPVRPQTDRGKRRLAAENALRAWSAHSGVAVVILRVSGIYGPGRLPAERLQRGLPVLREDQSPFTNRIHADDLALVCHAAAERAPPDAIYNVADGHPTTMSHYFNRVADVLGLLRPPAIDLGQARSELSPAMLSFLEESRRINNRRLLEELGIELRYPDLDRGLAALQETPAGTVHN